MAQRPKTQPTVQAPSESKLRNPRLKRYGAWLWLGLVLVGLAVIPTIYSGLLVSSVKDPLGNLGNVPAAIVNMDQPADARGEMIRLGGDLVDGLVSPGADAEGALGWRPMSEQEAQDALESGEVQAVLTIPEGFSASAAALSTGETTVARPSTLRVQTNDGAGTAMGSVAASVGETAAATVAEGIGEQYVHTLLTGLTAAHGGMREAAGGADRLSGGAQEATRRTQDLVTGLGRLAEGSAALNTGAARLADGAAAASRGSQDLAEGTTGVADGARQISSGLSEIHERTASLPGQATALAAGAAQVADGVGTLSDGAARLEAATGTLAESIGPFAAGLDEAAAGAQRLRDGTREVAAGTAELRDSSQRLRGGIEDLLTSYDSLNDEERRAALSTLAADAGRLVDEAGQAAEGAAGVDTRLGSLVGDASAGTGLSALVAGTRHVANGAGEAAAELSAAAAGMHTLADGADQVAASTQGLAAESGKLADGIGRASSGAEALAAGATELDRGARRLAERLPGLASGAAQLESGSSELSTELVAGQDGARQISTGLGKLSGHTNDLADALSAGVEEVPAYSPQQAADLAAVAAAPVSADAEKVNEVPSVGYGLAAYFMALALWVGALGYFLTRSALHTASLNRGGSVAGAVLRSIAVPALVSVVQSLLMVAVMMLVLDGHVANGWGLAGMALLTSLTFFATNQALMALFGPPGQFIAPLMMVVQLAASGGMYPVETAPEIFQAIHPWLPMTYALESFRSLIAGGPIGIEQGIVVMCAYLAASEVMLVTGAWLRARALRRASGVPTSLPEPVPAVAGHPARAIAPARPRLGAVSPWPGRSPGRWPPDRCLRSPDRLSGWRARRPR